jgi:hypothetical protein
MSMGKNLLACRIPTNNIWKEMGKIFDKYWSTFSISSIIRFFENVESLEVFFLKCQNLKKLQRNTKFGGKPIASCCKPIHHYKAGIQ